jgi:hypothetical protein
MELELKKKLLLAWRTKPVVGLIHCHCFADKL